MLRDAVDSRSSHKDEPVRQEREARNPLGTIEVQILLSWFFESSSPQDLSIELPKVA